MSYAELRGRVAEYIKANRTRTEVADAPGGAAARFMARTRKRLVVSSDKMAQEIVEIVASWLAKERFAEHKARSKKAEKQRAKDIGACVVKNSGAGPIAKGDYRKGEWVIQHKDCLSKTFTVSIALVNKCAADAAKTGRKWALVVDLAGQPVAVMPYAEFTEIMHVTQSPDF